MTCPAFHYLFLLFFSFLLLSVILGHGVTILSRLALNSQSSCRDLTSSGATHVYHHTWLMYYFLIPPWLVIKQLLFLPVRVRKRSEKLVSLSCQHPLSCTKSHLLPHPLHTSSEGSTPDDRVQTVPAIMLLYPTGSELYLQGKSRSHRNITFTYYLTNCLVKGQPLLKKRRLLTLGSLYCATQVPRENSHSVTAELNLRHA